MPASGRYAGPRQADEMFSAQWTSIAQEFLLTMRDYPPSQTPGSFNLDSMQKRIEAMGNTKQ